MATSATSAPPPRWLNPAPMCGCIPHTGETGGIFHGLSRDFARDPVCWELTQVPAPDLTRGGGAKLPKSPLPSAPPRDAKS